VSGWFHCAQGGFPLDAASCRLDGAGYCVQLMASCAEATAGLRERLADLLLLDVSLPDGSGMQLCRQLKHAPATACMPIVILTGWSMLELRAEAIAAGAADLLAKPFSIHELHTCVTQQLASVFTAQA